MINIITVYKDRENKFQGISLKPAPRYAFQVAFPDDFSNDETVYPIVLWGHGSYSKMKYAHIIERTTMDEFEYIAEFCNKYKAIAVMPALPRDDGTRTTPPLDTQILSRFTMIHNFSDFYYRPDLEILEFLDNLKNTLKAKGYKIKDKYVAGGVSAGASLAERISFLHPVKFSSMAILCAGVFMYPLENIGGINLPYPFGIYDLNEIPNEFKKELFDSLRIYLYVGELETDHAHDSLRYETAYEENLSEKIEKVCGDNPYARTLLYNEFIKRNGNEVKLKIGKGVAHQMSKEDMEEAFRFLITE